ncbi:3-oxoacyl-[acyl-carrier-protein] reductase [bacterium]|nr:MAG: 3-oxoacyl-[acyl-carrier-protein] reductase [bacterium]
MTNLTGKTILVTGSNRGIGYEIALLLAKAGATVAITARSLDAAKEAAAKIGGDVHPFALDVTDADSVAKCAEEALGKLGKIDAIVNNAGITRDNLAMRMKKEDWDAVIDSNLTGAFRVIQAFLRPMLKQKGGSVINITSVVAASGNPGQPNYCAAKAGLEGLTRSLALEYAGKGLRFNCVAPGFIETDMTAALKEEQRAAFLARIPLGRLGSGEDVAKAVAFLASDDSSYITGQILHVNGGLYLA